MTPLNKLQRALARAQSDGFRTQAVGCDTLVACETAILEMAEESIYDLERIWDRLSFLLNDDAAALQALTDPMPLKALTGGMLWAHETFPKSHLRAAMAIFSILTHYKGCPDCKHRIADMPAAGLAVKVDQAAARLQKVMEGMGIPPEMMQSIIEGIADGTVQVIDAAGVPDAVADAALKDWTPRRTH